MLRNKEIGVQSKGPTTREYVGKAEDTEARPFTYDEAIRTKRIP